MKLIDAIKSRKSIRGYTSKPVSKDVVKEILKTAVLAPSGVNSQAWEFAAVTGEALDKIRQTNIKALHERIRENNLPRDDFEKGTVYRKRQVELAKQLFAIMDIPRDDLEKRLNWLERGFRFFDAPVGIVLFSDKSLPPQYEPLDIGAVMYGICLVALKLGLGTCIVQQGVIFEGPLRKYAGIPDTKKLHTAIALGYPNWNFPANQIVTPREAIDDITIWKGFSE